MRTPNPLLLGLALGALIAPVATVQLSAPAYAQADPFAVTGLPLFGRVVGPDGSTLANVPVYVLVKSPVSSTDPATHQTRFTTQLNGQTLSTNAKGEYTAVGVKPGDTVAIFVTKPGFRYVSGGVVASGFDSYRASDLVVAPPTEIIAGKVFDDAGNPVPAAAVIAPGSNLELQGTTDPTGHFVLEGLPKGRTELFALTKTSYGRITADTGAPALSITLKPVILPTVQNVPQAAALLADVQQASYGTNYAARDSIAFEPAPYDIDEALKLANLNTAGGDAVLLGLVSAAAGGDVVKSAAAVNGILDRIVDPGQKALGAAVFGLELARVNPEAARPFLEKAKAAAKLSPIERMGGTERVEVAALMARLNDKEASKLLDDTIKAMQDGAKSANKGNPMGASEVVYSMLAGYAVAVAPGGSKMVDRVVNQLPDSLAPGVKFSPRTMPRIRAAFAMARFDAVDAASLLKRSPASELGAPIFGQAAVAVVEQLAKTDPAAALALAQQVTDQEHKAVVLALAARAQPVGTSSAVWTSAMTAALASPQRSALAGWVASMARPVSPELSANLFAMAWGALSKQVSIPGGLSAFQFYYSQLDPGQARLIAEKEYAIARLSTRSTDDSSQALVPVLTMAAVDTDRALEMARALESPTKFIAMRKIAQYLMLPTDSKRTLRFDRWSQPDAWLPGSPVER
ncbi:MAG TPA: hypothetical protein VGK19_03080 [Capsulimonadaceae bacterium]|jgi:hypothetical protein